MKKIFILFILLFIFVTPTIAVSYNTSPYQGTFSSSQLQVLRDIAQNVSPMPYVAWRDSEDDYCIAYGDSLSVTGTTFSADECTIITISSVARTEYFNSYIDFYRRELDSFTLNTNNVLVYSNLFDFPTLSDKETQYAEIFLLITIIFIICFVMSRLMRVRLR